jgi:hypothetical protein
MMFDSQNCEFASLVEIYEQNYKIFVERAS